MKLPPATPTLREEVLQRIAATGGIHRYPAHTVLIHEGERNDTLFILLSGRVKVYASHASGREIILTTHGAGEYVGELALDGDVRSASVMTLEPCTCSLVSGRDLDDIIKTHPDFARHLIMKLIRRVRQATESVKKLALYDVYGRIIALLDELSRPDGERRIIDERLTRQDIADRVGASRERVTRILKALEEGGFIEARRGRIAILKKPPAAF